MKTWQQSMGWFLAWALAAGTGAVWLAHDRMQTLRDVFDTDARIAHRLLSQRMVQHDAILGTLALLQPPLPAHSTELNQNNSSLSHLYPQVRNVARREATDSSLWPSNWPTSLHAAEQRSASSGHAELADSQLSDGQLYLVQSALPASYALHLDLRSTIPTEEWPIPATTSPVRAWLTQGAQTFEIQPGATQSQQPGWAWEASKTLASPSQPLTLHLRQKLNMGMLPWLSMAAWALLCAALLVAARAVYRQREARQRAEQLLHLGQVARLNTLGELAAGMAHELNQPLTAILSSSQAARRLLDDANPDAAAARHAMAQAAEQAKRASAVVGRLRRLVERPDLSGHTEGIALPQAVAEALHLLDPELRRQQVHVQVHAPASLPLAQAEPVALQQILHNLLTNALQAMASTAADQRRLTIHMAESAAQLQLTVQDSGPGIAADMRDKLFTPFATSRDKGLGLGLTLSESLAESMGGSLTLQSSAASGACFALLLPAHTPSSTRSTSSTHPNP